MNKEGRIHVVTLTIYSCHVEWKLSLQASTHLDHYLFTQMNKFHKKVLQAFKGECPSLSNTCGALRVNSMPTVGEPRCLDCSNLVLN